MKVLWTERCDGVTHSRMADGTYDPPLPAAEVAKRAARLPLFHEEIRSGEIARCETDATFASGKKHFSEIYGEDYANEVRKVWDSKGISYTSRTDYEPSLADHQGDTNAILEGRTTIKRREAVLDRARKPDVDPFSKAPRLSKRAIADCAKRFAAERPDEARKMDAGETKAAMIERHAMLKG